MTNQDFSERRASERSLRWIVLIVFLLHAAMISPAFFPSLNDIGVWDESTYINEGRELVHGKLPLLARSPAAAAVYALTYLPVHSSPFWLVHSCSLGRFISFTLLWLAGFLVAREIATRTSPFIMIALMAISPALGHLLGNGSDCLFAAMSGFALWQFLAFQRMRNLKNLWLCSFFLGLAALSRNEGPVHFLVFLGLALAICVPARLFRKGLIACLVPFTILVGGYILLYGLRTGDFITGQSKRSYLAFEQGQGLAFSKPYGDLPDYVGGQFEARRLFGTPEENNYSVLTAIRRNPAAYLQRIPPLTRQTIKDALSSYGWYFGLLCFAFAARGIVDLVKRKSFLLLATLLLWPSYCILYVLLVSQFFHVAMAFSAVFALASLGISSFALNLDGRKERYLWSVGFLGLAILAATRGTFPNDALAGALIMLLGFWLVWFVTDQYPGIQNLRAIGCLILLSVGLLVRFGIPQSEARVLGSSPDEQAVLYLAEKFEPGTHIGAYGGGKVWNARMEPVRMARELRNLKSAQDFWDWMNREQIEAIYADDTLRTLEPAVWEIVERQIGNGLSVAFESGDGAVRILTRSPGQ